MHTKFLIVTNHSYMLWQFRRELIAELLKFGEVVISMPFVGHEDDFINMGCRCINTELNRRSINPITDYKLYKNYKKLIKTEKPDIVITYSIKPNIYAGIVCRQLKIPYCVNVQGLGTAFQKEPIASIASVLYKFAVKKAKTVFFENENDAEEFRKRNITTKDKQTILKGAGVNLDYYQVSEYPPEDDGIHFLFVGRIMREKGVDEFFDVAKRIKAMYGNKVVFDVVGLFEDEYQAIVNQLVQEDVIVFYGFQVDTRPFYKKCHCVVLPSYHEGMNNVLLEASATGRTLITTDVPGCREAVENGVSGILCMAKDSDSLFDSVKSFIEMSKAQRKAMGERGRALVAKEFDKSDIVKITLQSITSGIV